MRQVSLLLPEILSVWPFLSKIIDLSWQGVAVQSKSQAGLVCGYTDHLRVSRWISLRCSFCKSVTLTLSDLMLRSKSSCLSLRSSAIRARAFLSQASHSFFWQLVKDARKAVRFFSHWASQLARSISCCLYFAILFSSARTNIFWRLASISTRSRRK